MQIEFDKDDLLTEEEFLKLILKPYPVKISSIIVPLLSKYIVLSNKKIYILQKDNSYTCEKSNNNKILVFVSKFISISCDKLNKNELNNLSKYWKAFDKIFNNSFIYSFFPQLKVGLTNNDYNIL